HPARLVGRARPGLARAARRHAGRRRPPGPAARARRAVGGPARGRAGARRASPAGSAGRGHAGFCRRHARPADARAAGRPGRAGRPAHSAGHRRRASHWAPAPAARQRTVAGRPARAGPHRHDQDLPEHAMIPRATVRLQLHAGFTLYDAAGQVPYYARLGISHFYLSPLGCARRGSTHGYDVVDHSRVNPELGGEAALERLVNALRKHDMGLIADIVPNHMAADSANPWWRDVLARGPASRYAEWFDIDWRPADPALHGKVLLPCLAEPYGETLRAGGIVLVHEPGSGEFAVQVGDAR